MEYNIKSILSLSPIIIHYEEDGEEREDLFFFSPDENTLIPGFGEDEGPEDLEDFARAFQKKVDEDLKKMDPSAIAVPGGKSGDSGLVLPR